MVKEDFGQTINGFQEELERDLAEAPAGQLEKLAEGLLERYAVEGSDTFAPEDPVKHLKEIGAWSVLRKVWNHVCGLFSDGEKLYGDKYQAAKLSTFKSEVGSLYSEESIGKFLNAYGILDRKVNRAGHKSFLPDGSWISNGVRFGP